MGFDRNRRLIDTRRSSVKYTRDRNFQREQIAPGGAGTNYIILRSREREREIAGEFLNEMRPVLRTRTGEREANIAPLLSFFVRAVRLSCAKSGLRIILPALSIAGEFLNEIRVIIVRRTRRK